MSLPPVPRFSTLDKLLHWVMAALFVWQFVSRWLVDILPTDHPAVFHLTGLHSVGGFTIFAIGTLRIYRAIRRRRARREVSPALALAAKANHLFLYGVMLIQPVTGFLSVGEKPAAEFWGDVHSVTAVAILVAIAVHMGAALWHHFVWKDFVLRDMLPTRNKPQ
jgi:cytochrome b561